MKTIADYIATLTGSECHRDHTRRYLERLAEALQWHRPADLRRVDLERWLADQTRLNRSARSRNAFQTAANSFGNWCVRSGRMVSNPFERMPKANLDADRRRQRRALTPEEMERLIIAAQTAPSRPPMRRGEEDGRIGGRPAERLSGQERAEVYTILAGTGLRVGELAQLTVADVRLDERVPRIELPARITKNKADDTIPLRADLVELLRRRVARLAPSTLLYAIPTDMIKRFNADCRRAGIPKRDERGRTVDIHALRTTFGTWLARSGVAPRTAQALMRHSDIKLTMSVYTDPKLLDTAAAVESIPSVAPAVCVAPSVAPTPGNSGATQSSHVKRPIRSRTA
jgi:integrase